MTESERCGPDLRRRGGGARGRRGWRLQSRIRRFLCIRRRCQDMRIQFDLPGPSWERKMRPQRGSGVLFRGGGGQNMRQLGRLRAGRRRPEGLSRRGRRRLRRGRSMPERPFLPRQRGGKVHQMRRSVRQVHRRRRVFRVHFKLLQLGGGSRVAGVSEDGPVS